MKTPQAFDGRIAIGPATVIALKEQMEAHHRAVRLGVFARDPEHAAQMPACPECGQHAEELTRSEHLHGATLYDFKPCGHRFYMEPLAAAVLGPSPR